MRGVVRGVERHRERHRRPVLRPRRGRGRRHQVLLHPTATVEQNPNQIQIPDYPPPKRERARACARRGRTERRGTVGWSHVPAWRARRKAARRRRSRPASRRPSPRAPAAPPAPSPPQRTRRRRGARGDARLRPTSWRWTTPWMAAPRVS